MAGFGYAPSQMPAAAPAPRRKAKAPAKERKAPAKTGSRPQRDPDRPPRVLGQSLVRSGPAPAAPRYNPGTYEKPQAPVYKPILPVPQYASPERGRPAAPAPVGTPQGDPNTRGRPVAPTVKGAPQYDANSRGRPVELPPKNTATMLQSQPGLAPAAPPAVNLPAPPPDVSDGVREMLNSRNWKLPARGKTADMPKSSFEKGGVTDLEEYDYKVNEDEWNRIQATYSTPQAQAAGYIPPSPSSADIDKNTPLVKLDDQESVALTWEAYEKLNDGQRAAVDFNTLLVDAREKDLDKRITLKGTDRTDYDTKVLAMFGAGHGSDVTAVNTVKLLSQFDMAQVGQDLDEYLSLERGIDTTELPDFKFSKGDLKTLDALTNGTTTPAADLYAGVRSEENMNILDTQNVIHSQEAIKAAMAKPSPDTYNFETLMYGSKARPKDTTSQIGYGLADTRWEKPEDAQMNQWFQDALTVLSAQDPTEYGLPAGQDPMEGLLTALPSVPGYNSKSKQQFLNYIQNRTDMLSQYGSAEEATTAALTAKRAGLGG